MFQASDILKVMKMRDRAMEDMTLSEKLSILCFILGIMICDMCLEIVETIMTFMNCV